MVHDKQGLPTQKQQPNQNQNYNNSQQSQAQLQQHGSHDLHLIDWDNLGALDPNHNGNVGSGSVKPELLDSFSPSFENHSSYQESASLTSPPLFRASFPPQSSSSNLTKSNSTSLISEYLRGMPNAVGKPMRHRQLATAGAVMQRSLSMPAVDAIIVRESSLGDSSPASPGSKSPVVKRAVIQSASGGEAGKRAPFLPRSNSSLSVKSDLENLSLSSPKPSHSPAPIQRQFSIVPSPPLQAQWGAASSSPSPQQQLPPPPSSSSSFPSSSVVSSVPWCPFTFTQWQELEQQALIFKHFLAGAPVPSDLIAAVRLAGGKAKSEGGGEGGGGRVEVTNGGNNGGSGGSVNGGNSNAGSVSKGGGVGGGSGSGVPAPLWSQLLDAEPRRCRRTDGKKWRCSREVVPDQKYCDRHMHRGRHRAKRTNDSPSTPGGGGILPRSISEPGPASPTSASTFGCSPPGSHPGNGSAPGGGALDAHVSPRPAAASAPPLQKGRKRASPGGGMSGGGSSKTWSRVAVKGEEGGCCSEGQVATGDSSSMLTQLHPGINCESSHVSTTSTSGPSPNPPLPNQHHLIFPQPMAGLHAATSALHQQQSIAQLYSLHPSQASSLQLPPGTSFQLIPVGPAGAAGNPGPHLSFQFPPQQGQHGQPGAGQSGPASSAAAPLRAILPKGGSGSVANAGLGLVHGDHLGGAGGGYIVVPPFHSGSFLQSGLFGLMAAASSSQSNQIQIQQPAPSQGSGQVQVQSTTFVPIQLLHGTLQQAPGGGAGLVQQVGGMDASQQQQQQQRGFMAHRASGGPPQIQIPASRSMSPGFLNPQNQSMILSSAGSSAETPKPLQLFFNDWPLKDNVMRDSGFSEEALPDTPSTPMDLTPKLRPLQVKPSHHASSLSHLGAPAAVPPAVSPADDGRMMPTNASHYGKDEAEAGLQDDDNALHVFPFMESTMSLSSDFGSDASYQTGMDLGFLHMENGWNGGGPLGGPLGEVVQTGGGRMGRGGANVAVGMSLDLLGDGFLQSSDSFHRDESSFLTNSDEVTKV